MPVVEVIGALEVRNGVGKSPSEREPLHVIAAASADCDQVEPGEVNL